MFPDFRDPAANRSLPTESLPISRNDFVSLVARDRQFTAMLQMLLADRRFAMPDCFVLLVVAKKRQLLTVHRLDAGQIDYRRVCEVRERQRAAGIRSDLHRRRTVISRRLYGAFRGREQDVVFDTVSGPKLRLQALAFPLRLLCLALAFPLRLLCLGHYYLPRWEMLVNFR